jgi:YVTN family beta-propeller protein
MTTAAEDEPHRSPIALALSTDGSRLLTANQTAGTVSLIDTQSGRVLDEVATGEKPAGVAISPDGTRGVVTHWYGYDLAILEVGSEGLKVVGRVEVGPEPRGVVLAGDGRTAYVAVGVSNEVVRVDLDARQVTGRLTVGREPRGIALTPDGSRLLVGNARSRSLSVIATAGWTVERTLPIEGDNLRQVAIDPDGRKGYVANMRNRGFATTRNNIDQGWVLGQRIAQVVLDGSEEYGTLSLDPRGQAAADAHGVAIGRDGRYLAVSCGGTHEVMLFRAGPRPLPWRVGGSRDLIPVELLKDDGRFRRVPLGGRPTELAFAADGKTLYVANYLADAVQVVDADSGTLTRTIALGGPETPSLARRGEMLFHDATRSFNQWYSCNTCHSDGHTNGLDFDTLNDGARTSRPSTSGAARRRRPCGGSR